MATTIDEIRDLVALQLGRRTVAASDRLVEDLGARSLDLVNVVAAIEDRYEIEVPEEDLAEIHTVADLHARVSTLRGG